MKAAFRAVKYIQFLISSGSAHGLHSPFVYYLYTSIIRNSNQFYSFEKAEAIRSKMLLNRKKIEVYDFGTGAKGGSGKELSLSFIASHSVKPKKYGQLLFRLVNHFSSNNILEIGTSLGITTLYLALPNSQSRVITLEGSPNIAAAAKDNFNNAGVRNIEVIVGEFSETLPMAFKKIPSLDFVYFDGNHQKEPTLRYFQECLKYHHENSVFVFDDIYWSSDMAEAWEDIKMNEAVAVTIDLYSIGLVFFKKGLPKQNFRLRF